MSEYIVTCDDETASWIGNEVDSMKPIVRCRDCEYVETVHPFDILSMKPSKITEYHCNNFIFTNYDWPIEVESDGFCAWGERREQ